MKKIISSFIVAAAVVGYVACGEPKPATGTSTDSSATMQDQTDTSTTTPAQPDSSQQR